LLPTHYSFLFMRMKSLFMIVLVLLEGVLSQKIEERHAPKCRNPKGKLWSSILDGDCGQSVCRRSGKHKASWEKCPRVATEEKLDQIDEYRKIDNNVTMAAFKNQNMKLEKLEALFVKLEEIVKNETSKVVEKVEEVCNIPKPTRTKPPTTITTTTTTTKTTTTITTTTVAPTLAILTRLPTMSNSWSVRDGYVDAIDFVPSKNIMMRGISLHRIKVGDGIKRCTGLIRLKEDSSKKVITSQNFDFTTDDSQTYFDQLFTSPGNLKAGVKYTITLAYDGSYTSIQYGLGGLTSVSTTCNGESITFQFSSSDDFDGERNNGSGVSSGQIPRILFTCSGSKKQIHQLTFQSDANENEP